MLMSTIVVPAFKISSFRITTAKHVFPSYKIVSNVITSVTASPVPVIILLLVTTQVNAYSVHHYSIAAHNATIISALPALKILSLSMEYAGVSLA